MPGVFRNVIISTVRKDVSVPEVIERTLDGHKVVYILYSPDDVILPPLSSVSINTGLIISVYNRTVGKFSGYNGLAEFGMEAIPHPEVIAGSDGLVSVLIEMKNLRAVENAIERNSEIASFTLWNLFRQLGV